MKKINKYLINTLLVLVAFLFLVSMTSCSFIAEAADQVSLSPGKATSSSTVADPTQVQTGVNNDDEIDRPEGWTDESHGNGAEPDYEVVFPQDAVNRIDITITTENWALMLADMTELMGDFGSGQGRMQGNRPNFPGAEVPEGEKPQFPIDRLNPPEGGDIPEGGRGQPPGGFEGGPDGIILGAEDQNPVWVTATIEFEGEIWEHVGIRFKGNSSLRSAWSSGNLKIPFKLDFDQFEADYSEIDDQRFYGFKQLSLANNFNDDSYLREKVTADIFREFGVPAAHTAFYEVFVDTGDGPQYFSLYTMVEMVEDTLIEEQFSAASGNLYKPEGSGATFAQGSYDEGSFDKETNQDEGDYADILAVFDALHAENRLSDPAAWRESLESVFDASAFLRWLAVNTVVQNWDTYGVMNHNYYLYTDPETGLVTWIPWDNNMALTDAVGKGETLSLSLAEVTEKWPLIRFLIDDPVYQAQYEAYLVEVVETAFVAEKLTETYTFYHKLIADWVLIETDQATTLRFKTAFDNSLQELIDHAYEREQAVEAYLSN